MTTIVNGTTPTSNTEGNGLLIGIILIVGLVVAFLYFGIPAINRTNPTEINVSAPETSLPDKVNVNVDQKK